MEKELATKKILTPRRKNLLKQRYCIYPKGCTSTHHFPHMKVNMEEDNARKRREVITSNCRRRKGWGKLVSESFSGRKRNLCNLAEPLFQRLKLDKLHETLKKRNSWGNIRRRSWYQVSTVKVRLDGNLLWKGCSGMIRSTPPLGMFLKTHSEEEKTGISSQRECYWLFKFQSQHKVN